MWHARALDGTTRAMAKTGDKTKSLGGSYPLIRRLMSDTARQYAPRYAVALFFMAMVAGSTALMAWLMRDIVNKIFVDQRADELVFIAVAVIAIALARGIGAYGSAITLSRIGNRLVARVQDRVYNHLLDLGVDYYDKSGSSHIINNVTVSANSARTVLETLVTSAGRDFLSIISLCAVMIIQSPIMFLATLLIGPPAVIGVQRLRRQVRDVARVEVSSNAKIISVVQETAIGIRVIKAFVLEPIMRERMNEAIERVRGLANKLAGFAARTNPLMETLGGIAYAGLLLWAGYAAIYQNQKPGAFIAFIMALLLAYEPVKRLANTQVKLEQGMIGVRIMYEILDTEPTMKANRGGPKIEIRGGEVVFDHVNFGYDNDVQVLRDLSFHAEAGKTTALVGPSGSGKSTMMSLIERFYDVTDGRIRIDGQDITTVDLASLRAQMAFVSQDTALFNASIRENIHFGRPEASLEEVEQAARDAMAHDFIVNLPEGYDTMLGDQGIRLSGGQRQRLAIARAMLRDAPIVLLDEATSSLDSESEHQIQVAFDRLIQGRTTIVIAHRLSTVLHADKICVLVAGEIVEQGRHAELLAAGGQYARLYHLQFERPAQNAAARERAEAAKEEAGETAAPEASGDTTIAAE